MTDWSAKAPTSPIREVEAQRKRVLDLRSQIPKRREQCDAASARVTELEAEDRRRMAQAMAAGRDIASDVERVERARADAAGAVRAAQALDLAIEDAELELHELVLKHRGQWTKRVERDVIETRAEGRETLAAFRAALERHRHAQAVEFWLRDDSGLDRGQATRPAVLGPARGSSRVTANASPVDLSIVFEWLEEVLAEPQTQTPPQVQSLAAIPH